jgi:S1-C subfamily serine protease
MTAELVEFRGRSALKVTSVQRRSPAQVAGLEDGDLIIAVNRANLTGSQQLDQAAQRGQPFSVSVADVRSQRVVEVQINPAKGTDRVAKSDPKSETPTAESRPSLGISAESVSVGLRTALKVTRVEPGTLAAAAGLEPGDIIVAANGAPVVGPEELVRAVRRSGPQLELTVRDSRTGRNTPVHVNLAGREPTTTWPADESTPSAAGARSDLGMVTELAFHNDEFAVKVSEVEKGGPAARAGLSPGMLILQVNGKPVLHPKEMADALQQSGRTVKLQVVDPRTGHTSDVSVALDGGS